MVGRRYSLVDRVIAQFDAGVQTLYGRPRGTGRPSPANELPEPELDRQERRKAARLMRVNHCGEICAQALYQAQAITTRNPALRQTLARAAAEENDHLAWCEERLMRLGSHTSYLNPLFYIGSLGIGALAGAAGDRWSLGFLAQTEEQVVQHLSRHLQRLPRQDRPSRAIVEQMRLEEDGHASSATAAGAARIPRPVRQLMRLSARAMTGTTYWI
ncbi:2-polyprenyl-3-methyl-6-methoxy-1,4-benzoquinone monooxygenase [Nitrococcus mobilis]|uniref:3-demethoxyubiquinol 3-hydroxylase n=1 Tax=Nitrococcus mobilis Nb-231 TaxID=314278 RepID=A4BPG2_9GAMM|nr:2-polyprenyl-3-methyl-6-methoxy-1,4-benzoquinone monooxygenase [Nitrococcus mobilis]EAR22463.1 putative ubiquinone biosynthesis protein [Nitrococcus mobilis Nb-231]